LIAEADVAGQDLVVPDDDHGVLVETKLAEQAADVGGPDLARLALWKYGDPHPPLIVTMRAAVRERDATYAVVFGVLGMFCGLFAPVALRIGLRSLRNINSSHGALTGTGSAIFGVVAGAVGTLFLVAGMAWFVLAGVL